MNEKGLLTGGILLIACLASSPASAQTAKAEHWNAQEDSVGSTTLAEGQQGVRITVESSMPAQMMKPPIPPATLGTGSPAGSSQEPMK